MRALLSMGIGHQTLAIAICTALLAVDTVEAIEFTVSGHVNREIRFADDGIDSDIQHLDNEASRSRIRIQGEQGLGNGITAGVYLETSVASNDSAKLGLKSADGGDVAFDIRHSTLFFRSQWGTLWFGHTSEAFDSVTEVGDLSGTALADEPFDDHTAAIAWRTSSGGQITDAAGQTLLVGGVRGDFDGGRLDVGRYDSPKFGPFSARVSVGDNQTWSVRGLMETNVANGDLVGAIGYLSDDNDAGFDGYGGSIGYRHSGGLNVHAALGLRDRIRGGADASLVYLKAGYQFGHSAVSASYSRVSDFVDGIDSERYGFAFVHTLSGPGVEFYANFQHYPGLDGVANVEDINSGVVGTRIRF